MADNYQIELTLDEIFGTGISSIEQTTVSTEPGGENIWTVTLTNGNAYNFTVLNGTAGGDPIPVLTASAMTDTSAVYLYLGSETGYTFGHWYYYDATWKDGGAYGAKGDKGEDGEDGADGFSPIATVTKSGTTTTISITDENGTTTAEVEDGVRPVVNAASVAGDMTDTDIIYVYVGETTASLTNGDWYFYDGEEWASGGAYNSTALVTDKTLTQTDMAADAKKVGDEINDLKSQIQTLESIPYSVKLAMDALFSKMAVINGTSESYASEVATIHAWATEVNLLSISVVFEQGQNVITPYNDLDDLRQYLTVTAHYDNGTETQVTGYTLSGNLEVGTSTITVGFGDKSGTFTVAVSEKYSWSFADGDMQIVNASPSTGSANGIYLNKSSTSARTRRAFVVDKGETPFMQTTDSGSTFTATDPPVYPIPVPRDATSVTVSITPSARYVAYRGLTLDNGVYTMVSGSDSGYQTPSATTSFEAGTWDYMYLQSKYDSGSSTTYSADPTEVTVVFGKD